MCLASQATRDKHSQGVSPIGKKIWRSDWRRAPSKHVFGSFGFCGVRAGFDVHSSVVLVRFLLNLLAPRALNRRVQNSVFLRRPSKTIDFPIRCHGVTLWSPAINVSFASPATGDMVTGILVQYHTAEFCRCFGKCLCRWSTRGGEG
jgi:hypothetical protein